MVVLSGWKGRCEVKGGIVDVRVEVRGRSHVKWELGRKGGSWVKSGRLGLAGSVGVGRGLWTLLFVRMLALEADVSGHCLATSSISETVYSDVF